jgi:hypothetical protein
VPLPVVVVVGPTGTAVALVLVVTPPMVELAVVVPLE